MKILVINVLLIKKNIILFLLKDIVVIRLRMKVGVFKCILTNVVFIFKTWLILFELFILNEFFLVLLVGVTARCAVTKICC